MDKKRSTTNQNEIVIKNLVKQFDEVTAVNNLNLEIHKGEMFGFLGPNGAGKTTTISILCGLQAVTSRTAHIGGRDIWKDLTKIKERIGVCPQEAAVFKFLTGKENVELMGNLHGMDKDAIQEQITDLLSPSDFTEVARRKAKGYSGGLVW